MNRHDGPYGSAEEFEMPDVPHASETVCQWLVNSPIWHPAWSQYMIVVIRLREGVPWRPESPHYDFDGADHQMFVMALDPKHHQTLDTLAELVREDRNLPYLRPINMGDQFEATDEEMRQLAGLMAWGVVHGIINPETSDAPERIRLDWLTAATKTLAHIRGEQHAP